MKKTVFFILALFAIAELFAQERVAIAVFPFEDMDKVFTGNESVFFYRRFSNEFVNKNNGRFRVIPRQDVEKLINTEAAFQLSEFSAKAKTAEFQRVLNGAQILSGYIGKMGNKITISISLYTFPDLEQLPGGVDLDVPNVNQLFEKIPELVQSMQDRIVGGGAGGNTGSRTGQTYKIGDIGPAGGFVFYDKGVFSNGWRYLEAAPAETEFTAQWTRMEEYQVGRGKDRETHYRGGTAVSGTGTVIGSGKRNTELIVESLRRAGQTGMAAQLCANLKFDNFTDWFLPSKDELDLMYKNLKLKGLGGFSDDQYWSSSQSSDNLSAWEQFFKDGYKWTNNYKHNTNSVRAVRAF